MIFRQGQVADIPGAFCICIFSQAQDYHIRIPGGDEMDNWSYVEDVASALAAAVLAPRLPERHIFNVGGDYRSRREFGEYLQQLVPEARVDIEPGQQVEYRPRHVNDNIGEALGFVPEWSMERGVKATVNAARERAGLSQVNQDGV